MMKEQIDQQTTRIDVDQPLWNQDSYFGRWKHFAFVTDFRTIFTSDAKLREAKKLCEDYKVKKEPECTKIDDVIHAKKLRDAAFHPDNGELMNVVGRMSFQLPGSLIITTGMLTYYKTMKGVLGWQLANQGFNAVVNYTNRNAQDEEACEKGTVQQAFLYATTAGCVAALAFRKLLSCRGSLVEQWAPFIAVAAANMVNLPVMRQNEIKNGIPISSAKDDPSPIMKSKIAGIKAVSECVISRIAMAAPGMILIPVIMRYAKARCFYQRRPWIGLPLESSLCGLFLSFMIPTALAIYPQRKFAHTTMIYVTVATFIFFHFFQLYRYIQFSSTTQTSMNVCMMKLCQSEWEEYQAKTNGKPDTVFYNKGL